MLQDGRDWDVGQLSAASQRLVLGWSSEFVQVMQQQDGGKAGGLEQPVTRRRLHRAGEVWLQPRAASAAARTHNVGVDLSTISRAHSQSISIYTLVILY